MDSSKFSAHPRKGTLLSARRKFQDMERIKRERERSASPQLIATPRSITLIDFRPTIAAEMSQRPVHGMVHMVAVQLQLRTWDQDEVQIAEQQLEFFGEK